MGGMRPDVARVNVLLVAAADARALGRVQWTSKGSTQVGTAFVRAAGIVACFHCRRRNGSAILARWSSMREAPSSAWKTTVPLAPAELGWAWRSCWERRMQAAFAASVGMRQRTPRLCVMTGMLVWSLGGDSADTAFTAVDRSSG